MEEPQLRTKTHLYNRRCTWEKEYDLAVSLLKKLHRQRKCFVHSNECGSLEDNCWKLMSMLLSGRWAQIPLKLLFSQSESEIWPNRNLVLWMRNEVFLMESQKVKLKKTILFGPKQMQTKALGTFQWLLQAGWKGRWMLPRHQRPDQGYRPHYRAYLQSL